MTETNEMKLAVNAAREAGKVIMKYFEGDKGEVAKGPVDFVTKADLEAEKKIVSMIKEKYPDHMIITEEGGDLGGSSDYQWLIDPLDGTANYVAQLPLFGTSIALQYKKETILGVIYFPVTKLLFTAEKDKGSFLNGKKISLSDKKKLKDSKIVLGFYRESLKEAEIPKSLDILRDFLDISQNVRKLASASIALCYVAWGKLDGYVFCGRQTSWDFPAGALIVEEAGGIATDFFGNKLKTGGEGLIISNKFIYDEIFNIIKKYW